MRNHHHNGDAHAGTRNNAAISKQYLMTVIAPLVHDRGQGPRRLYVQFHVEILALLQGEEYRGATLLNDVDNNKHWRLFYREPKSHRLMNRRRL